MSFTVSFSPCRFRGRKAEMLNPFTKQLQEFEIPEPLTPAQWKVVVRVLKAPDEDFDTLNVEISRRRPGANQQTQHRPNRNPLGQNRQPYV